MGALRALLGAGVQPDLLVGTSIGAVDGAYLAVHGFATEGLDGLEDEFREKGITARKRIVHGPVVEAILTTADREKADFVAIASHARAGLSRVFCGSVAAGVLHRIDQTCCW